MMLQSEQDSLVTPGAAWPKFRARFSVTGGKQAHWAQQEQGRPAHEIVHSYIYSKEVTSSNLYHQLMPHEGQRALCGVCNEGKDTLLLSVTQKFVLFFV